MTADQTLYAGWTANALTFNAQSKSSYYNTSAKTVSITGASNGTGSYTYSITSQVVSGQTTQLTYFTISGTTITVKASTPVGVYKVTVKAVDNGSAAEKSAEMTITVRYPKLTLNGNNGTVTQGTVYTKYGTANEYTQETGSTAATIGATRTGYTLSGWYTAASGGTKVLDASGNGTGTAVTNYTNASKQWVMTADQTLYAGWTINTYTVAYNSNKPSTATGTVSGTTANSTHTYNEAKNLTANGYSLAGWTFAGWNSKADGTGTNYTNSQSVTNLTTGTGTVTLYAKWTENTYSIKFNGNGSTGGSMSNMTGIKYEESKTLTANAFERKYTVTYNHNYSGSTDTSKTATYTFNKWNSKADGTGTAYNNSQSVSKLTTTNNGTFNMYAQWTSASVTYVPTRTGYTFGGWYAESGCTTQKAGTDGVFTPTANITVYAKWTENTYSIKFNGNGSTGGSMSNMTGIKYTESKNLTANAFERKYTVTYNHNYSGSTDTSKTATYTFNKWNSKADGTGTAYNNSQSVSKLTATNNGTFNMYAQWTSASVTYVPTRTGYTFGGWYAESGCTTQKAGTNGVFTPTANITLYAKWTENTYNITLNNGSATTNGTGTIYEVYATNIYLDSGKTKVMTTSQNAITVPQRKYTVTYNANEGTVNTASQTATYTFKGYYDGSTQMIGTNGFITSAFTNTKYSANKTLTADWTSASVTTPVPTRTGYTFKGWYDAASGGTKIANGNASYTPTADKELFAQWTASPDIPYVVKHWQLKVNGTEGTHNTTNYDLKDTENLTGTADSQVTPAFKTYTGFTPEGTVQTVTIAADGSTIVNYYYRRNKYNVTLNKGAGINTVTGAGMYLYGENVTINATLKNGYTWSKWTGTHNNQSLQNYTFTMPASDVIDTANATYTANITLTRSDYNTFTYSAPSGMAYYVSTSNVAPNVGTTAASTSFVVNTNNTGTWTTAINTGELTLEEGVTYYVWVKDSVTGGNISPNKASIAVHKMTRSQGTGSTLTTGRDGTSASSTGTAVTDTTTLVLHGTPFWSKAVAKTGYNTPVLKEGNTSRTVGGYKIVVNNDVTISSSATANTYNITYDYAGGTVGTNAPTSGTYDQDVQISNPSKTGYTFSGWTSSTTDGLGANAKAGTSANPSSAWSGTATKATYFRNLSNTNNGSVKLTATWTPYTYTIEYYQGNNSSTAGATKLGESIHNYNESKNLTTYANLGGSVPTPGGWTFYGWSANNGTTATSRTYTNGQSINLSSLITENNQVIKLYAIFSRNIDVYSGINKASGTVNRQTQRYNPYKSSQVTSITLAVPNAVEGWDVLGYRTDTNAETQQIEVTTSAVSVTPEYNVVTTYYAVYSRDYTANFFSGINKITNIPVIGKLYYNTNSSSVPTTVNITLKSKDDSENITNWTELG